MSSHVSQQQSVDGKPMHPVVKGVLWTLFGLVVGFVTLFGVVIIALMNSGL